MTGHKTREPIRIALTFDWVGEDVPFLGATPSVEEFTQLFYVLTVLYGDAFEDSLRGMSGSSPQWHGWSPWRSPFPSWSRFVRSTRPTLRGRRRLRAADWPKYVPLPPSERETALGVEAVVMASPLELILVVPSVVAVAGGALGALRFIKAIEDAWNMPRRITLERAQIDRELWEARLGALRAQRQYAEEQLQGFRLTDGRARFPDGWKWPDRPSTERE